MGYGSNEFDVQSPTVRARRGSVRHREVIDDDHVVAVRVEFESKL
jgi:hypothetical protein